MRDTDLHVGVTSVTMNGGRAVAEMMAAHGVRDAFGMGGFQLLPYYEGIRELGIRHHLTDDERSAAFAVDAQARLTGRPGVVDATLGPGATNLVTALAESQNAGIPLVALVGDTHRLHSGKNMTQETAQVDVLRPVAKELIRIERGERIPELMRRAFALATAGRPGPVVVDLPEDVAHEEFEFGLGEFWADEATGALPARRCRPDADDVARAASLLKEAERPLVLAGGGVHLSGAYDALLTFATENSVPVAHTLSGKGAIPCVHDLSVGLFGRYSRFANELIARADCLFAVGCKLGEIATRRYDLLPPDVPLVHLDSDPNEIGRWARVAVGLWGDARAGLSDLTAELRNHDRVDRTVWAGEAAARRADWQNGEAVRAADERSPIGMGRMVAELNRELDEAAVVVADGGFASHWTGLLYDTKTSGRGFISDRGFASIGYGLPGALGASLAAPHRTVVGITGDGGLNMSIGGLETARRVGAAFTLIVVNNAASGYVKALQHAMYGPGHYQSSDLLEMDYAAIAAQFGCVGIRVEKPSEFVPALRAGIAERRVPTVLDVVVTRDAGEMLPGVDNRTAEIRAGDRIA